MPLTRQARRSTPPWRFGRRRSTDWGASLPMLVTTWRSVDAYAARHGLVGDDFDRFVRIIRAMDATYLDYFRKPEG